MNGQCNCLHHFHNGAEYNAVVENELIEERGRKENRIRGKTLQT